jgi:hypothetical protein
MAYPTYNPTVADTSNLIGKQFTGLHTQDLTTTGIQTDTIVGYTDRYQIDLFGNMQSFEAEETPLLTLLSNLATESVSQPVVVWNDVYRGNQWFDIHIDDFRLYDGLNAADTDPSLAAYAKRYSSLAYSSDTVANYTDGITADYLPNGITAAAYVGGQLPMYTYVAAGTPLPTTDNTLLLAPDPPTNTDVAPLSASIPLILNHPWASGNAGAGKAWLGFYGGNAMRGNIYNVWNNLRNPALFAKYAETVGDNLTKLEYTEGTAIAPLYLAIDSMIVTADNAASPYAGTYEHHHSVLARIDKAVLRRAANSTIYYIWFELNFNPGASNFETELADGLGSSTNNGVGLWLTEPYGAVSRMIMLGSPATAAKPIPEGDKFVSGTNINRSGERMENFTQIFVSPSYGITGTAQASKLRFLDTFQETRAEYLTWYKRQIEATLYNGVKAETTAVSASNAFVNGQPVRQMGGLFDRALFPLRFFRAVVPNTAGTGGESLRKFIDQLANSINAFKNKGAKDITFLCSGKFKRTLSTLVDQYMGTYVSGGNTAGAFARGGMIQRQVPSQVTFNLQVDEFVTIDGITVKFIHDKALDYAPSLNLPYYLSGNAYGPRDVLIALDMANIKRGILRPDQIHGNIQDPGQDAFLEAMRGESTLMVRFPRNHTIVMLDYE